MIVGAVTADLLPLIPLTFLTDAGVTETTEAVVDTGFTAYITLPKDMIDRLGLSPFDTGLRMLGDGQIVETAVYMGRILWQGREVIVSVDEAQSGSPLVGMELLLGNIVTLEVRLDGPVTIAELAE